MEQKYYKIRKKYLAAALGYIGFKYYKFNEGEKIIYSFEDTNKFRQALTKLTELKNEINQ